MIAACDPGYDDTRKRYNAMIDKRPAVIARCADTAHVMTGVNFACSIGVDVAVRGGGHNGAGLGSVDGGLVIDGAAEPSGEGPGASASLDRRLASLVGPLVRRGQRQACLLTANHHSGCRATLDVAPVQPQLPMSSSRVRPLAAPCTGTRVVEVTSGTDDGCRRTWTILALPPAVGS